MFLDSAKLIKAIIGSLPGKMKSKGVLLLELEYDDCIEK